MRINAHKLFAFHQLATSFVLLPVCYIIWMKLLGGRHEPAFMIASVPIVFGYAVPGIGTNITRLWEFRAGIRLGKYTLLHGLMFGGATLFLTLFIANFLSTGSGFFHIVLCAHAGLVIIGFWNWLFDIYALRKGLAVIYNKPRIQGKPPEVIVTDYAPVYFGTFGACFAVIIHLAGNLQYEFGQGKYWLALVLFNSAAMFIPVAAHVLFSFWKHGYSGLRPYTESNRFQNKNEIGT